MLLRKLRSLRAVVTGERDSCDPSLNPINFTVILLTLDMTVFRSSSPSAGEAKMQHPFFLLKMPP